MRSAAALWTLHRRLFSATSGVAAYSPTGTRYASISPTTDQLVKVFENHSWNDVQQKISIAEQGFAKWKALSYDERAAYVKRAAKILDEKASQFAPLLAVEMGKPLAQGVAEIQKSAFGMRWSAENCAAALQTEIVPTEVSKSYIKYQPLGIVLGIFPWNFPFWQVFRFAGPALMAGNVFLMKHAPNCPQSALAVESVFKEAGFPDGVCQNLFIDNHMCADLIHHKSVKAVSFTGSTRAGAIVAAAAAKSIKKAVLELGGSDPFIVLKDADLDHAVEQALIGRTQNAGQSCIAAKRFIVEAPIYDAFTKRLTERMSSLVVGDPLDSKTQMGPLARHDLMNELHRQVKASVQEGAKITTGGARIGSHGCFYTPTVLTNIDTNMTVFKEETFGPVAPVIEARDVDHAIELANMTEYGLGGAVFTRDLELGQRVVEALEAGQGFVNSFTKSDPRMPFGGVKQSGFGRECSHLCFLEFVNAKTVFVK